MKHQNGFGSIVKLGGKRRKPFAVRITAGWQDGKQLRKYIGYYTSEVEALMALAEYHKGGVNIELNNATLNDVFQIWIKDIKNKNLSDSVVRTHEMAYKRFGTLGNKKIKDIKSIHLQTWINNLDLKPSSKKKMVSTLIQIWNFAVNNDICIKNYANSININEKVEQTGAIFTKEEIKTLWDNVENNEAQQLLILIYTGMRIGELLAIRRKDINFEDGYITGGSKTEAGRNRIIPLHDEIKPLVIQQLGEHDWLVRNYVNQKISYERINTKYRKLFEKLGMKHKIHDTRKTAVSIMHSAGIPMETIRVIIGHSGKGVTEKVYLYKNPKELVDAINTIKIEDTL